MANEKAEPHNPYTQSDNRGYPLTVSYSVAEFRQRLAEAWEKGFKAGKDAIPE
jgi:hypothetical protein